MPDDEVKKLWEEFNNMEVEEPLHYSNVNILSRLIQITTDEKKNNIEKES